MHFIYKKLRIALGFSKLIALLVYFFFITYWICFIEENRTPITFDYEYRSFWIISYVLEGILALDAFHVGYKYFISVHAKANRQVSPDGGSKMTSNTLESEQQMQVSKLSSMFYIIVTLINIPISPIAYAVGYRNYADLRILRLVSFIFISKYWENAFAFVIKSIPINRVVKSFVAMAVIGHAAACGYYALGIYELNRGQTDAWLAQGDYPLATGTSSGEVPSEYLLVHPDH